MSFFAHGVLKISCQKILTRTELFEKVEKAFCFAVCEEQMRAHYSAKSSASMTAASREVFEKRDRL